mmetsp:Transcript_36104/g.114790  ORF Transcript_36104/g.114790 Transcript_36104/m.114790 type:complete len:208 (-) Transcript_36104:6-629(-)
MLTLASGFALQWFLLVSCSLLPKCLTLVMTFSSNAPLTKTLTSSAPRVGSSPGMYSSIRPHCGTRARFTPGPNIMDLPFALNSFAMARAYLAVRSRSQVSPIALLQGNDVAVPGMVFATPLGPSPMLISGIPSLATPGTWSMASRSPAKNWSFSSSVRAFRRHWTSSWQSVPSWVASAAAPCKKRSGRHHRARAAIAQLGGRANATM